MAPEVSKNPHGHPAKYLHRRWSYVVIFVSLILPIVIVSYISYQGTKSALSEFVLARRQNLVAISASVVGAQFDGLTNLGTSLAGRPLLRQYAGEGKWYEAINVCQDAIKEFPVIERLFMTDTKGIMVSDLPVAAPSVIGQSRADKDWYKGVSKDWQPYVSEIFMRGAEPKINIIAVAAPVRNDKEEVVGVLVLQIRLSEVLKWLQDVQPEKPAFIYLVDQHGNILGHPWYPEQGKITNFSTFLIVQKVLRGERGLEEAMNPIDKEQRLSAYEPVAGYGWGAILAEPVTSVYAQANRQLGLDLIIYGLLLLAGGFSAAFALFLLSRIVRLRRKEKVIMDSIGDAVVSIDRHWNIVFWNKAAERLTGWSAGEALGRPMRQVLKFVHDADGSENIAFIEEAMLYAEVRKLSDHTSLVTKDGKRLPIGDSAAPLLGPSGTVDGAVIIFRDISLEAELAAGEEMIARLKEKDTEVSEALHKFRELFENVPDAVIVADPVTRKLVDCNKKAERLLGRTVEELRAMTADALHPKDRVEETMKDFAEQSQGRKDIVETEVLTKDGQRIPVEINAASFKSAGKPYLLGVFRDISERKRAERALLLKNIVFEASIAANSIADTNGVIIELNDEFLRMWGYADKKEVIGKPLPHFFQSPEEAGAILAALSGSGKWTGEFSARRKDGSAFSAYGLATDIKNPTGKLIGYQSSVMDITDRKKAEHQVAQLDKLKNKFIQTVSHQLRTPMTAVRWSLDELLNKKAGSLTAAQQELLQMASLANADVTGSINDLMTAMDIEEGRLRLEKEPTIFEDVVRSACLSMRPRYELKEFKHVHDFPDAQSTPVNIDIARIREVVIRLLENAVAYTKEGGQLTTRVFKTDSKVRYELSDTGIGIPKAEQTMIFERFRRGSNAIAMKPDGVGLGLYITQSIIESHGGRIGVTSEEGKGSTFWFELPLAKEGGVELDA